MGKGKGKGKGRREGERQKLGSSVAKSTRSENPGLHPSGMCSDGETGRAAGIGRRAEA